MNKDYLKEFNIPLEKVKLEVTKIKKETNRAERAEKKLRVINTK